MRLWNNLTDDVIYRCWQRTGIIPEEHQTKDMSMKTIENEEEAEGDKCPPLVSHKIALESIQILLNYLQQSNNVGASSSVLLGMKDLRQIRRKQVDSLNLQCNYINVNNNKRFN